MSAGTSILVVEDEPAIQELIAVNLEHAGHRVLRAASADNSVLELASRTLVISAARWLTA